MSEFSKELNNMASQDRPMPTDLDQADQLAYQALSYLYKRYRAGQITKERAVFEKDEITNAWSIAKSDTVFLKRSALKLSARIDLASDRYANERTLEAADEMYRAFWNGKEPIPTGDYRPVKQKQPEDTIDDIPF